MNLIFMGAIFGFHSMIWGGTPTHCFLSCRYKVGCYKIWKSIYGMTIVNRDDETWNIGVSGSGLRRKKRKTVFFSYRLGIMTLFACLAGIGLRNTEYTNRSICGSK